MRSIFVLCFLISALGFLVDCRRHYIDRNISEDQSPRHHRNRNRFEESNPRHFMRKFNKFNSTVNNIIASKATLPTSEPTEVLWDLLRPISRYILLNQEGVRTLDFTVKNAIENNSTDLSWATIPNNIKTYLLGQQIKMFNQTLKEWRFVDENDEINGNKKLISLVPVSKVSVLKDVNSLIEQLPFDLVLNMTALVEKNEKMSDRRRKQHQAHNPVKLVEKFISNLFTHVTKNQRQLTRKFLIDAKKTLLKARILHKNHQ